LDNPWNFESPSAWMRITYHHPQDLSLGLDIGLEAPYPRRLHLPVLLLLLLLLVPLKPLDLGQEALKLI
jgi:hypothetical protein